MPRISCAESYPPTGAAFGTKSLILTAMWFGQSDGPGVEVPDELISALAEGRLVLFVGAGASVNSPSDLPTFQELTKRLCEESHEPPPVDSAPLDKVLGDLKLKGVDVHQRAKDIIGHPGSKPNELHRAIAGLASAKNPRIVTTNYDRHLSACLESQLEGSFDEYPSLAFPQREDFTGIVYLHGSVKEPARHLVVTDADFGKAYLEAPWTAAQFLSGVFRRSTVLFIGYSHDDTLMEYLARSLPADETSRFALCCLEEAESDLWQKRGIEPINYGDHEALPELLRKWAERSRMGILDHRRRVETILRGVPPLSREDESYLQEAVSIPERLRFFTESARGVEWLRWAENLPDFKSIFDPQAQLQPSDLWIKWFVEHHAMGDDPKLRQEALSVFLRHGGRFSNGLWDEVAMLCRKPLQDGGDAARDAKRWLPLLIQHVPMGGSQRLEWLLDDLNAERDQHAMLLLLDKLLEPQPTRSRYTYLGEEARLEPSLEGPIWILSNYWSNSLRPNLSDEMLASSVAVILDRHLRAAHMIAASNDDTKREWAGLSYSRSAIEDHEQDKASRHERIGLLVDMARDTMETLLQHHPDRAENYMRSWDETQMPVLRRLAIHGWAERQDVAADEKVAKLCSSDWVSDGLLIHEAMRLAAVALPKASPERIDNLVEHVEAGLQEGDEYSERRVYDWLAWIVQHASGHTSAEQALAAIQARHPEWAPSEHPDFLSWGWSETVAPPNLGSPEDLHQRIEDDPAEAVRHLLSFPRNEDAQWDEPRWWDALDWLRNTLEEYPTDGVSIIDLLIGEPAPDDIYAGEEIAKIVLGVWTKSDLDTSLCQAISERLLDIWATGNGRWETNSETWGDDASPLNRAINHWSGDFAEVVLQLAKREYRTAGENWAGLPNHLSRPMELMANGSDYSSNLAQVVLASRLGFLFAIDDQWCRDTVLILLDPDIDGARAIRCWDGYLMGGIGPPKLLETGLLNLYIAMAQHLGAGSENCNWLYAQRLAVVALFSGINPIEHGWLDGFTAAASGECRVEWIRQISYALPDLSSREADAQWDSWMRDYWRNRLDSKPRALADDEATTLADWTVSLGSRFPEAVDLACKHRASIARHSMAVIELLHPNDQPERIDHLEEHPEHTARLLTHLLSNTETTSYQRQTLTSSSLDEMIPGLISRLDQELAHPLEEQAARLSIHI